MITNIPNWQNLTAQELLDYLLVAEDQPDKTSWTLNNITKTLGAEVAGKIEVSLSALAQAGTPFAQSSLLALATAGGLPLWEPHVGPLIDSLAAASQSLPEALRWDAAFVTAVKGLGTKQVARWVTMAYLTEPTLVSVQAELDQLADNAAQETVAEALYGANWNTHVAPVLQGDRNTATIAALATGLRNLANAIEGV